MLQVLGNVKEQEAERTELDFWSTVVYTSLLASHGHCTIKFIAAEFACRRPEQHGTHQHLSWAGKMSELVNLLAVRPDNLTLIPKTNMVGGENQFLKLVP